MLLNDCNLRRDINRKSLSHNNINGRFITGYFSLKIGFFQGQCFSQFSNKTKHKLLPVKIFVYPIISIAQCLSVVESSTMSACPSEA